MSPTISTFALSLFRALGNASHDGAPCYEAGGSLMEQQGLVYLRDAQGRVLKDTRTWQVGDSAQAVLQEKKGDFRVD